MFWFALFVLLVSLAAFAAGVSMKGRNDDGAEALGFIGFAGGAIGIVLVLISCFSVVPTRNVGIVTAFGKPTGRTTGAGLQGHAPWQSIDDWDASGQTFAHLGDHCIWVAIAGGRKACIPVQVEWNAKAERAPENWGSYKELKDVDNGRFGAFTVRRVEPQMKAAVTSVFASFDPLTGNIDKNSGSIPAPDLNKSHKGLLEAALKANLGTDIEIRSIAFETPRYDDPTTKAIAEFGQKTLEARNLEVDKVNAETRKEITNKNAQVDRVTRCLEIAEKSGKEPGLCMGNSVTITKDVGTK